MPVANFHRSRFFLTHPTRAAHVPKPDPRGRHQRATPRRLAIGRISLLGWIRLRRRPRPRSGPKSRLPPSTGITSGTTEGSPTCNSYGFVSPLGIKILAHFDQKLRREEFVVGFEPGIHRSPCTRRSFGLIPPSLREFCLISTLI